MGGGYPWTVGLRRDARRAVKFAQDFTRAIVKRVNSYTGTKYSDDPTIMAWELANEPRGGRNVEAFNHWLRASSDLIKSLDSNHLVTTGSEGETPWPAPNGLDLALNHSYPIIGYVTAHIWAQNWSWFDPAQAQASYPQALAKMDAYLLALPDLERYLDEAPKAHDRQTIVAALEFVRERVDELN